MKYVFSIAMIIVILAVPALSQRINFTGKVLEISEDYVLNVDSGRAKFNVRLQFVDPPEKGQPLFDVVQNHLRSMVLNQNVRVQVRYVANGIHISRVLLGDRDVSMQLLRDGAAWYSHPEAPTHEEAERNEYQLMEQQARSETRGIWGVEGVTPAWELRQARENTAIAEKEEERKRYLENLARTGRVLPSKPQLGMEYIELFILCGSHARDGIRTTETERGKTADIHLVFTQERAERMCFGHFTFENNKLTYISRSSY